MFTKSTELLGLPQWEGKDHPDFLTDMNDAYRKIDEQFQSLDGLSASTVASMDERLIKAEDSIIELGDNFETLVSELKIVTDAATATADKVDSILDNIVNLEDAINTVDNVLENEVKRLENADVDLEGQILNNTNNINSIHVSVEAIDNELSDLTQSVGANSNSLNDIQTLVVALQGDVNRLDANSSESIDEINSLNIKVNELEQKVTNNKLNIDEQLERISNAETAIEEIQYALYQPYLTTLAVIVPMGAYTAGQTIAFSAAIVENMNQIPIDTSNFMYINPKESGILFDGLNGFAVFDTTPGLGSGGTANSVMVNCTFLSNKTISTALNCAKSHILFRRLK